MQLPEALELNLYPVDHHVHGLELMPELLLKLFAKTSIPPHALDALQPLPDLVPRPLHTFLRPLHTFLRPLHLETSS